MENENNFRFEDFFKEKVRERGIDLKKLSENSGIALKHLNAIAAGDFKKLPSAPYFRGYLMRLGEILDFDPEMWWQRLNTGGFVKTSGSEDRMPKNRFVTKINSKILWISAGILVAIIYLVIQLPRILGRPEITITFPQENPAIASFQELNILGTVENASELKINGESIQIEENGLWQKKVLLQSGPNPFEITAKKFLGRETKIELKIIYQPVGTPVEQ